MLLVFFLSVIMLTVSFCTSDPRGSGTGDDKPVLKAAARTFSISPRVGQATSGRTGAKIEEVTGDLINTIVLFEYGDTRLCFVTSSLSVHSGAMNIATRALVAKQLGIRPDQVVASSSHNHTVPRVFVSNPEAWGSPGDFPHENESNEIARDFLEGLSHASSGLDNDLVPVTVEYGIAHEDRLVYERRGRRPDGRAYFIREEDRLELEDGYTGTIDPDAMVVVLKDNNKDPVAAMTLYTGHPVTGYNPERMASHGQWPQVACEKLSEHLGDVPVAFFQGCCGDINSKYMLSGTLDQADELGEFLGESFIEATKNLQFSKREDLHWDRKIVQIPHKKLPDSVSLKKDMALIDDFIRRGEAGDENTLECVGLNFPKALSPPYRARLVELVRPWYVWALDQHRTGELSETPEFLELEIVIAGIGEIGFVGLPFEPFVRTGLKIKREALRPFVFTSGYTDGSYGYIPDESAIDDLEYMGGNYRYHKERPPFRSPGADALVEVVVQTLNDFPE